MNTNVVFAFIRSGKKKRRQAMACLTKLVELVGLVGLDWIVFDWLDWIGWDWIGRDWMGLDVIGWDWLDCIGLHWSGWVGLDGLVGSVGLDCWHCRNWKKNTKVLFYLRLSLTKPLHMCLVLVNIRHCLHCFPCSDEQTIHQRKQLNWMWLLMATRKTVTIESSIRHTFVCLFGR